MAQLTFPEFPETPRFGLFRARNPRTPFRGSGFGETVGDDDQLKEIEK